MASGGEGIKSTQGHELTESVHKFECKHIHKELIPEKVAPFASTPFIMV